MTGATSSFADQLAEEYLFSALSGPAAAGVQSFQAEIYRRQYGRIPKDDLDERADFLVATDNHGELVGSIRVILSSNRPFTFEGVVDLSRDAGSVGSQPAEIGRWCVREDRRAVATARGLHFGLMKAVYLFARRQSVSAYLMYVYPELERFYKGLFFEDLDLPFEHPDWGRVRMFSLNMMRLDARLGASTSALARYLLAPPGHNFALEP